MPAPVASASMRRAFRRGIVRGLAPVVVLGALVLLAAPAGAAEAIADYRVALEIRPNGALIVTETIAYDFGTARRHGIFRTIPVRVDYPAVENHDRVYPVHVLSVQASAGASADYLVEHEGNDARIRIGDPDETTTGAHTYVIRYRVDRAMNAFDDHDELVWNAIGTEWALVIGHAEVSVQAPGSILAVNCSSGPYGASLPCATSGFDGSTARFSARTLYPFNGMTVSIALPKGVVPEPRPLLDERWTFARAFSLTPATVGIAGVLLAGGVVGLVTVLARVARDRRFRGSEVDAAFTGVDGTDETVPLFAHRETPVEFVPPEGLRPGQVGTLADFQAHPLDVTATIVDLGVRGYLRIDESGHNWRGRPDDWTLTKLEEPTDLLPYERALVDGLFRGSDSVELSSLRNHFATRMRSVQTALVDDAIARGWFNGRPSTVRAIWFAAGLLVLVVGIGGTIALAATTRAGIVAVPLILIGAVLAFASRWMPRRTAKGYAMLRHVDGFRRFIDESEKERARFAERAHLFSEYLPYAVVFGATKQWARAFEGLGDDAVDTSSWYHGTGAFQLVAFSHAVDSFAVATAGTLTSTPPSTSGSSGFSGGGFSGGGGGGGGGGSW